MNWDRGLFRLWLMFTVAWVGVLAIYDIENWATFDHTTKYEVTAPNGQKYSVTAEAGINESVVLAYAQNWARKQPKDDCRQVAPKRGPWCDYPAVVEMPHHPNLWPLLAWLVGGPVIMFALGYGIRWIGLGFLPKA